MLERKEESVLQRFLSLFRFFCFYFTGTLVFFRQALLSFSSEMDPRCWRQNNNSKCFTLLNGVDVVDTARKLWVGVQSCQSLYLYLLSKEKDLCLDKLRS